VNGAPIETLTKTLSSTEIASGVAELNNATTVTIVPANQETIYKQVRLNAKVSDSTGSPLTYAWRNVTQNASIIRGAATLNVQLISGFGNYVFEVMVTNGFGQSGTATTTVALR
jgi:hypothetical protein